MLAIRKRHHVAPTSSSSPKLAVLRVLDAGFMAALQQRPLADIESRFHDGHHAYVAFIDDEPTAWGWAATQRASIGELSTTLELSADTRYLWNFVTLPAHRGRGIYPRLIDAIIEQESDASTFLIAYAPENHASAAGIRKAGFEPVAEMSFDMNAKPALRLISPDAAQAVHGLSLPLVENQLTPCWKCVRAGRSAMNCQRGTCQCDYQRKEQDCAA